MNPKLLTAVLLTSMIGGYACEGPAGAAGPQGPAGAGSESDGGVGPQGEPGEPGEPGAPGEQGAPGSNGVDGVDGDDGTNGTDGVNGDPGADGADGVDGVDGEDGVNGVDGVDGDDGAEGPQGVPGVNGEDGEDLTLYVNESCAVCHDNGRMAAVADSHVKNAALGLATVAITDVSVTAAGIPTITFSASFVDGSNQALNVNLLNLTNPTRLAHVRVYAARLDPDLGWVRTINGEREPDDLVKNADGTYTFTADTALNNFGQTHRIAMQISGITGVKVVNPIYDFRPDEQPIVATSDIASTASCNECHGELAFHGGGRVETKMCVVCHNPSIQEDNQPAPQFDFMPMVHRIHASKEFEGTVFGAFPQPINNCRKCHDGTEEATPDGDAWMNATQEACTTCHDNVVFVAGGAGEGQVQHLPTAMACNLCHTADLVDDVHTSENNTPFNPGLPAGLVEITYDMVAARMLEDGVTAEVDFSILRDGAPLDLSAAIPADLSGSPSFLLAYAMPTDDNPEPVDYDNAGRAAAQPATKAIYGNNSLNAAGAIVAVEGQAGVYRATIAEAFPAGAKLRAVALQGSFTQCVNGCGNPPAPAPADDVARHAVAKIAHIDTPRREVVDSAKCANCHEWFEGHGGNRVYEVAVCVTCHVPNLSSSGRTLDPANLSADVVAALGADPLTHPEASNNFKELIHGIHAGAVRDIPYEFVRNRSTGFYYDWSHVVFPGMLEKCDTCHTTRDDIDDGRANPIATWLTEAVPANALVTTEVTVPAGDATRESITAARTSLPNGADLVTSQTAGALAD